MVVSRRDFLMYCSGAAAALGFGTSELRALAGALAGPGAPTVLWLQGAGCTGCSISFLDYISGTAPQTAGDVLIDVINLAYHPNLMGAAGATSVEAAKQAQGSGDYVLVVEGGVPTGFGGNACWAWTDGRRHVTFQEAVQEFGQQAAEIVCVGQCSCFGGMWAAPPNPTAVQSVKAVTGRTTINVAGCPPHPDWIVWVIAQLVTGNPVNLDSNGRPSAIYSSDLHDNCPRRNQQEASSFAQQGLCLEELGCRGEHTRAPCPSQLFNGGAGWCIGVNAPCFGCTSPSFPGTRPFFQED